MSDECQCEVCKKIRERVRVSNIVYTDTLMSIDRRKIDLTYIPTPRFVAAYNAMIEIGTEYAVFTRTKNVLLKQGLVREKTGGQIEQV